MNFINDIEKNDECREKENRYVCKSCIKWPFPHQSEKKAQKSSRICSNLFCITSNIIIIFIKVRYKFDVIIRIFTVFADNKM